MNEDMIVTEDVGEGVEEKFKLLVSSRALQS
jgi:hypothetical protein